MPELIEQAEVQNETTTQPVVEVAPQQEDGIGSILNNALKESRGTPEVPTETDEQPKEPVKSEEEKLFLELMLSEANKVPFKTEEEFLKFIESNKVLKDGWLRQADYTRKTQEVSKLRDEFEQRVTEDEKAWGDVKPDQQSKSAIQTLWNVYAHAENPALQNIIRDFVGDVTLLAKGQEPVSVLRQLLVGNGGPTPQATPEVAGLKSEIAKLKQELYGFKGSIESEKQQAMKLQVEQKQKQANDEVGKWISGKQELLKSEIPQDVLGEMADIMSVLKTDGEPKYSLDQAYDLAMTALGRSKTAITKEVLAKANNASKKSVQPPSSKASAGLEPEPTTIKEILRQGVKAQLA